MIYRYNVDEEEYFLESYDEMHNHILAGEPRIIPYVKKHLINPIYATPMFESFKRVEAFNFDELQNRVKQIAKERCFDMNFAGVFGDKANTEFLSRIKKRGRKSRYDI